MSERVIIYDLSGAAVFDPEKTTDFVTNLNWESMWPKGYGVCSFQIRRRNLFADWVITESYGVKVFSGSGEIVYQGRIETLSRSMAGTDEYIQVQCIGWFVVLEERHIRKRWIDVKGISRLRWPDGLATNANQGSFVNTKREGLIQVFMGTGDIFRNKYEKYRELYELPAGYVRKVSFDYVLRSGERYLLGVFNVDNSGSYILSTPSGYNLYGWEWFVQSLATPISSSAAVTFALGNTTSFEFYWFINESDEYDQNDYGHISNLRVEATYESGHSVATPLYKQGELVEDILLLVAQKGQQLSTDVDAIGEPGYVLDPFIVEEPTSAMRVIEDIAAYGDASLQTWGLTVWSETGTTDNLPKATFEALSTSDYEYTLELSDEQLRGLTYEKISSELYNNVIVQYENQREEILYRDSGDNAALADSTSIASEYQRDYYIQAGESDTTRADYLGSRFIQYHKSRQTRATFNVIDKIKTKSGNYVSVNRVRAGQRIKLVNTGETFFIRHTRYDAESNIVSISPDIPGDNLGLFYAQEERGLR